MVTKTLSLVLVSMVRVIWLTRRLTRPATRSMNGTFQLSPGWAMRRNLPKRTTTATSAVFTVKKLPKTVESTNIARTTNKPKDKIPMAFSPNQATAARVARSNGFAASKRTPACRIASAT